MSELRVREPARDVPVVSEVDVAVAGGGTAGCMAAVGAAREGARTCLIENLGALGGAWNPCIIGHFGNRFVTRDGLRLVGGAPREVLERTLALGSHPYASVAEALTQLSIFYRADHCGEVLLQMMDESKVELWLQARFCAAQPAPGGGYDLFIETKGGRLAIRAKEVVDCTGEADVAAALGAPMKVAADRSWGYLFEMGLVDLGRYEKYISTCAKSLPDWNAWLAKALAMTADQLAADNYWKEWMDGGRRAWPFRPALRKAVEAGDFHLIQSLPGGGQIRYGWDGFWPEPWHGPDVVTANVCMVTGLSPRDARAVTQAEAGARKFSFEFLRFLRKYVPGFERASIRAAGARVMPRGGAEIVGEKVFAWDGVAKNLIPEDAICLAGDKGFGLPLGQFAPKGVDHLLVAGKCAANGYSIRASVTAAATGYSCGIVAAVAARQGATPMKLPPAAWRPALLRQGVVLEPGPREVLIDGYIEPDLLGVPYWDSTEGLERAKKLS